MAGHTYTIDLRGSRTNDGTLRDPYLLGVYNAAGNYVVGSTNDNSGDGPNSHLVFTATESGTHRIVAGARGKIFGTYELEVRDASADDVRTGAIDLGDITDLTGARFPRNAVDGDGDRIDYYRFTFAEAKQISLGLRQQDANADLFLEDAAGTVLASSEAAGTANEGIRETLTAGTYYVRIESQETGENSYVFRYGVEAPVPQAPSFAETGYAFDLAENADGSETPVALGAVSASDPEGASPIYSIVGGNAAGLFAIDAATGALSYTGGGEDHESEPTSHALTVRASDGSLHGDVTATVAVTDVAEAPAFGAASYAFDLVENADGSATPVALGAVSATDPEGSAPTYSIVEGNAAGLFAIDAATGALSYTGTGENYESEPTSYELTVRASDGSLHDDVTVAVEVTDVAELPSISVSDAEASESDGLLRYRVALDQASAQAVTVRYATVDGTAVAGEDYEATSGPLEFAPGQMQKHVEVELIDDRVEDSGETLVLRLSDAAGGILVDAEGTGTIWNSEQLTTVSETDSDFPASIATSGYIKVGESATGAVDPHNDRDWFAVTLEAWSRYRFDLEGVGTGKGTLRDPHLAGIHDAQGRLIAWTTDRNSGVSLNAQVDFRPRADGTYYVSAGPGSFHPTGTYTLKVTDLSALDKHSSGTDTTGTVAVGGTATGATNYGGDRDWFAVTLEADHTYWIDVDGEHSGKGTLHNLYVLGIYDSDGDLVATKPSNRPWVYTDSHMAFTASQAGTYYVSAGSDHTEEGTYTLTVIEAPEAPDYAAGIATAGVVAVGGSARGDVGFRGDRDWFAVTLEAGQTYRFDLEGFVTRAGTNRDTYLHGIFDSNGQFIPGTKDNNSGLGYNSRLDFAAAANGTYYVSAGNAGVKTGTYRLSVSKVADDFTDGKGQGASGTVAVGASATGMIEASGDQDWFAVTLGAGKTYRFDLQGSGLRDPYLRGIYDSNGSFIRDTTDHISGPGLSSRVDFTADEGGTYYVSAGANGSGMGTYRLSVTERPDDFAEDTGTTGVVAVGGHVTGERTFAHDRDWFAVTLEAGKTYRFDMEGSSTGAGTLRDPHLRGIYDSNGALLAGTVDDDEGAGLNARVDFTPAVEGTYYVSAGGNRAGEGTYRVSVQEYSGPWGAQFPVISVGAMHDGEIGRPGEWDWFAVELEAGRIYELDLDGSGAGALRSPNLHGIYNAAGDFLPGTNNGAHAPLKFLPPESGTYYVGVGGGGRNTGTFTLEVADVTRSIGDDHPYEPVAGAQAATAGLVAVGGWTTGRLDFDQDVDWFAVKLEEGRTYRVQVDHGAAFLFGVRELSKDFIPDSTTPRWDGESDDGRQATFTAPATAIHYVVVGCTGPGRGIYRVWVSDVTWDLAANEERRADGHAAGIDTESRVEVGGSASGVIDYGGDRDWFAVTLEAGLTYRFDMEGAATVEGTLPDPYLRGIFDSNGDWVAGTADDDGGTGWNARSTYTPAVAGTYYLSAGAWGDERGTYTVSVEEVVSVAEVL